MKTAFTLGCLLAAATADRPFKMFQDAGKQIQNHNKRFQDAVDKVMNKEKDKAVDIFGEVVDKYREFKEKMAEANDDWVALDIEIDGQTQKVYIATPFWFTGTGGDKIEIPYGGRLYLSNSTTLDPEEYFKPNFLGATVEYDVDLS